MIITVGAVVGKVVEVDEHPKGERIWLATVDMGCVPPVQIVFGGRYRIQPGELVPVAPPGARGIDWLPGLSAPRVKKMRARRYRGERSHGMLCSLDELGWLEGGPDEVAILRALKVGDTLDDVAAEEYPRLVVGWERAVEHALANMVDVVLEVAESGHGSTGRLMNCGVESHDRNAGFTGALPGSVGPAPELSGVRSAHNHELDCLTENR